MKPEIYQHITPESKILISKRELNSFDPQNIKLKKTFGIRLRNGAEMVVIKTFTMSKRLTDGEYLLTAQQIEKMRPKLREVEVLWAEESHKEWNYQKEEE